MWAGAVKLVGSVLSGLGISEIIDFISPEKETPSTESMIYGIIKYITIAIIVVVGFMFYKKLK